MKISEQICQIKREIIAEQWSDQCWSYRVWEAEMMKHHDITLMAIIQYLEQGEPSPIEQNPPPAA